MWQFSAKWTSCNTLSIIKIFNWFFCCHCRWFSKSWGGAWERWRMGNHPSLGYACSILPPCCRIWSYTRNNMDNILQRNAFYRRGEFNSSIAKCCLLPYLSLTKFSAFTWKTLVGNPTISIANNLLDFIIILSHMIIEYAI